MFKTLILTALVFISLGSAVLAFTLPAAADHDGYGYAATDTER
jgi:hypothetical protein